MLSNSSRTNKILYNNCYFPLKVILNLKSQYCKTKNILN